MVSLAGWCVRRWGGVQAELVELRRDHEVAVGLFLVLSVVILVRLRRVIPGGCVFDLGHDGISKGARFICLPLRKLGSRSLFGGVYEDGGAVLGSDIVSLPVERCGVVELPEVGEDVFVADAIGVKDHSDDFSMACRSGADTFRSSGLGRGPHEAEETSSTPSSCSRTASTHQ